MGRSYRIGRLGSGVGHGARARGGVHQASASIVFLVALALSMVGLSYAVKTLPTGTSYAVWVGIGASLTVAYGMLSGTEPVSVAKVLLIIGLIACVIGLKLVHDGS